MDVETLRRMQAVTAETWRIEGPRAPQHVGDLAWQRFQHRGREQAWQVRLWQRDQEDVAWAWLRQAKLSLCIHPDERASLAGEVLDWAEAEAGQELEIEVHSTDATVCGILDRRGYRLDAAERVLASTTASSRGSRGRDHRPASGSGRSSPTTSPGGSSAPNGVGAVARHGGELSRRSTSPRSSLSSASRGARRSSPS